MSSSQGPRPDTAAECLEQVAAFLTGYSYLIEKLLREKGDSDPGRYSSGNSVQLDLCHWAAYLQANPGLDAALMAELPAETNR